MNDANEVSQPSPSPTKHVWRLSVCVSGLPLWIAVALEWCRVPAIYSSPSPPPASAPCSLCPCLLPGTLWEADAGWGCTGRGCGAAMISDLAQEVPLYPAPFWLAMQILRLSRCMDGTKHCQAEPPGTEETPVIIHLHLPSTSTPLAPLQGGVCEATHKRNLRTLLWCQLPHHLAPSVLCPRVFPRNSPWEALSGAEPATMPW